MTSRSAPNLLVVDTDVLIDYLRDQPEAVAFLEGTEQPLATSVITVAELMSGCAMARSGGGWMPLWRPLMDWPWIVRRQDGPKSRYGAGGCPDRRQRRSGRSHPGHPEPAPCPDAGGGAGALPQGLNPAPHTRRFGCRLPMAGLQIMRLTPILDGSPASPGPWGR